MKQEIIFSDVFYNGYLVYVPDENRWECTNEAFYKKNRNSVESEGVWFTVRFSKKGEIESVESKDKKFSHHFFDEIYSLDSFKTYFEKCKELILDVRDLQLFTPNEFGNFYYDYNEKYGWFRFEESLAKYEFDFVPSKGMEKVFITYGETDLDNPQVKVYENPVKIFGEKQAQALNDMIKRQLKLRYFF